MIGHCKRTIAFVYPTLPQVVLSPVPLVSCPSSSFPLLPPSRSFVRVSTSGPLASLVRVCAPILLWHTNVASSCCVDSDLFDQLFVGYDKCPICGHLALRPRSSLSSTHYRLVICSRFVPHLVRVCVCVSKRREFL
jgi:hypothetical protein